MATKEKRFGIKYLNMIQSVILFALDAANVAITNSIAPFKDGITLVKNNYDAIQILRNQAKKTITGFAAMKRAQRKAVTEITYTVCKSVFSFATKTSNINLQKQMDITKRQLKELKYADFPNFVQSLITAVDAIIVDLAPYQITPATITNWQSALQALIDLNAKPNTAINQRKKLNTQAQSLLADTIQYFNDVLDPLSYNFQSNPATLPYFNEYRNNRRLKGQTNHTAYRVIVTDDNNNALFNILVQQDGTQNTGKTGINGECILYIDPKPNTPNVYSFTLSNSKQTINTGPVEVKKGALVTQKYSMQPANFILPPHTPQTTPVNA